MTVDDSSPLQIIHLAMDYGQWACGKGEPGDIFSFNSEVTTCADCIASGNDWVSVTSKE